MKISIVIPVYNTEAYLPACMDSILSQSFTDFEILLVDDGSKDGSGTVCDGYAAKDGRVRVFHKENGGVSLARNLALENATGDWITFVDSDDRLLDGGLQALVDGIYDDVDLVMADFIKSIHYTEGAERERGGKKIIGRNEALLSMFNDTDRKYQGYTFAKLFRREIIARERLRFDPAIVIKEDTLFVVNYLRVAERQVCFMSTPVYYYLVNRPSSAMESLNESYNPDYLTSVEAAVQIHHMVLSDFPGDRRLLYYSREELMNRIYRIFGNMVKHDAVDKGVISGLRKRMFREVGLAHYLDYEFRRDKRRLKRLSNKLFNTSFEV